MADFNQDTLLWIVAIPFLVVILICSGAVWESYRELRAMEQDREDAERE